MMSAVSTISFQSIGAGKKELVRKVLFIGIGIASGTDFVSEAVIELFTNEKQIIICIAAYRILIHKKLI